MMQANTVFQRNRGSFSESYDGQSFYKTPNLLLTAEFESHFSDHPSHSLRLQVVSLYSLVLRLFHHFVETATY
jgi:hypothetical protein